MTTDCGKWVWENLWVNMIKIDTTIPRPELVPFDYLGFSNMAQDMTHIVLEREVSSGYTHAITVNMVSEMNGTTDPTKSNGIAYMMSVNLLNDLNRQSIAISRTEYMGIFNLTPPAIIESNDENYPCFRVRPMKRTSNETYDDEKIRQEIINGNSVVDVPLVYKLAEDIELRLDNIIFRQPMIMPTNDIANNIFKSATVRNIEPRNDVIKYIQNGIEDILYQGNKDIDTFLILNKF